VKRALLVLLAVAALVAPAAASARVKILSVTSPVRERQQGTLVLSVSSPATCSIVVHYKSGPSARERPRAEALCPREGVVDVDGRLEHHVGSMADHGQLR
jgi:hypothetical protein